MLKLEPYTSSDSNLLKVPVYFQNALSTGGIPKDCAENLEFSIIFQLLVLSQQRNCHNLFGSRNRELKTNQMMTNY